MTRFSLASLRIRLLLLILLAVLPALGLTLYTDLEERQLEKMQAQEHALRLAQLAASGQYRLITATRQLLVALAQLPALRGGDSATCRAILTDVLKEHPEYTFLVAAEPKGDVFCGTLPFEGSINFADRPYFRHVLTRRTFAVGDYWIGPITNKPVLNVALPVLSDRDRVQVVLIAALDLTWLYRYAAEAQLPEGAVLSVRDRNGVILVRYPNPGRWVGQSVPEAEITQALLAHQKEGTVEALGLDGVRRLYAFTPLRDGSEIDGYINVGIPTVVAFAEAERRLRRNFTWLGLVTVLAFAAAWVGSDLFVLRRVRALVSATQRMSAGDLGVRTGQPYSRSELGQLGRAFDDMAEALERHEAEREHVEEDIRRLNAELEQRVLERTVQLETANKELEAFSYSVSHDLRAPLRAIHGFSRILLEDYAPHLAPDAQRYLRLVRDNAQQMGRLIDDLLAFSRLSRQPLIKQTVVPADLVRQVVADLHAEQEGRRVEIVVSELPPCQADPALLKQVFLNLLSNALKYTRAREVACIEVGCRAENEEFIYFVKDNGVGFDMRYVDKLFGVFQRLHRAEEYEGTGVGLALVQRIVHRHGGRVWAEAEEGKGATFYFTI